MINPGLKFQLLFATKQLRRKLDEQPCEEGRVCSYPPVGSGCTYFWTWQPTKKQELTKKTPTTTTSTPELDLTSDKKSSWSNWFEGWF